VSQVGLLALLSLAAVGGICLAIGGWMQPSPTLVKTLRHLRRQDSTSLLDPSSNSSGGGMSVGDRAGAVALVVGAFARHPKLLPSHVQLRLLRRSVEQHVVCVCVAAIVSALVPGAAFAVMQQLGVIGLGWYAPAAVAAACALFGPVLVHLATIERATAVRADLRYQVSAYLDVVTMLLAGNNGYEGALDQASRAGDGRLFVELRRRMRESAARGASLTDALQRTGSELGLAELEQVASTAALSAAEGAPVARTLAAKCATLRSALATEQESEARLRTSRLTTPIVGMALIFMALVIYPALSFS